MQWCVHVPSPPRAVQVGPCITPYRRRSFVTRENKTKLGTVRTPCTTYVHGSQTRLHTWKRYSSLKLTRIAENFHVIFLHWMRVTISNCSTTAAWQHGAATHLLYMYGVAWQWRLQWARQNCNLFCSSWFVFCAELQPVSRGIECNFRDVVAARAGCETE